MRAFMPPFRFTSFFSPEDTLLCMIASEAALAHARNTHRENGRPVDPLRMVELTTGSGLVGMHLLRLEHGSTLLGLDVDLESVETARNNARQLALSSRAQFECADLWSDDSRDTLGRFRPHMMICNPPYIPEPHDRSLEIEAGSGPDGTAHLRRAIELAAKTQPRALALSWCSVSDPAGIVRAAENAGFFLNSLFIVAIADGEYSGSVHSYLRTLDTAFINEDRQTIGIVAPDGAARFAYLLMAGDFSRDSRPYCDAAGAVERICREFSESGTGALEFPLAPIPVRAWLLDRWDEVRLRAYLHGDIEARRPASMITGLQG
jgi:hypothetical protein